MEKMSKKVLPLAQVYKLIEQGPVVLLSTAYGDKQDVMVMSWHMMIDFVPPILACVVSEQNYTFNLLKKSKECVINIPTMEFISKMVEVGNSSGATIDKFKKFHLLQEKASKVKAPLLTECYVNLECKVVDMQLAAKYNIFILKVVSAWQRKKKGQARLVHHAGNGLFVIDGKRLQSASKKK